MSTPMTILCIGSTGWIGSQCCKILRDVNTYTVIESKIRIDDYGSIGKELDLVKPTHVLLTAGKTGRPNIDWCEDHKIETIETNTLGTCVVVSECQRRGIWCCYFGTGCIYEYDQEHQERGVGFTEMDEPNFDRSWYSYTKILTEKILKTYSNVCICRIRMPISSDFHPRSFITKILSYQKVINVQNSMTILDDFLYLVPQIFERKLTGIYNFCNQGSISHNEILDLYINHIDPNFKYTNFTIEEQDLVVKAPRSNNTLNVSKILGEFPDIPHIKDSIEKVFEKLKQQKV